MVTVVEDPEVRYKALEVGASDLLLRSIDQYECRARCRNLLTLRRQQKIITQRAHWLEQQVSTATVQIRNGTGDAIAACQGWRGPRRDHRVSSIAHGEVRAAHRRTDVSALR
jgi:two-component system, response regulator RpfG